MPQKVTKAVIVAAGLGKRMFPFTKIDSKLLIPILNRPIALYLMEELHNSGIKEVVIVTNHISKLRALFTKDAKLNKTLEQIEREDLVRELHRIESLCKINYITQDEPRGWLHAVVRAKEFLKDEPFVVLFSDVLFKSDVPPTKQILDEYYNTNKNIYATARFVFKPNIFNITKNFDFPLGEDLADVTLYKILKNKNETKWYDIKGRMYDIGDPVQLLRTLLVFTLEDWYYSKKLEHLMDTDHQLRQDFENLYHKIKK